MGFSADQVRFLGYRLGGVATCADTGPMSAARCRAASVAIIEAMAASLPVVAGRVGGTPELYGGGF